MLSIVGEDMRSRVFDVPLLRARGFSLVELLAVLGIAGILLTMSVPGFSAVIRHYRITTVTNDFFMAINLTRAEAIRRGMRVDLIPAEGNDWKKGWIVLVDQNNNQLADPDEEVIFTHEPVPSGMTIQSVFTDSRKAYLAYNAAGRTRTNGNGQTPQLGTVTVKLDDEIRRIKLNFLGRPRSCNPINDNTCTGSTDAN